MCLAASQGLTVEHIQKVLIPPHCFFFHAFFHRLCLFISALTSLQAKLLVAIPLQAATSHQSKCRWLVVSSVVLANCDSQVACLSQMPCQLIEHSMWHRQSVSSRQVLGH